MKKIAKRMLTVVMMCALLCSSIAIATRAEAKSTYWISGLSKNAGGHSEMYFKGKKIVITGKLKVGKNVETLWYQKEKKATYTLSVADNCKVSHIEADNVDIIKFSVWKKNLKNCKRIPYIQADLKVVNNKLVRISFSA